MYTSNISKNKTDDWNDRIKKLYDTQRFIWGWNELAQYMYPRKSFSSYKEFTDYVYDQKDQSRFWQVIIHVFYWTEEYKYATK